MDFQWEQGDLVEVYGAGDEIIYAELWTRLGFCRLLPTLKAPKVFVDGAYKGRAPVTYTPPLGIRR